MYEVQVYRRAQYKLNWMQKVVMLMTVESLFLWAQTNVD